jgi:HEAT repeat protein
MPASSPASDSALLAALIHTCYALAAASVVVWLGCFHVRVRRLKRAARAAVAEEKLTGLVLDELAGYPVPADTYGKLPRWQQRILLQVLQNLVEQTKGRDQGKLIALMQRVGFLRTALETLASPRRGERQSACTVLGYFDEPAAISALRSALQDPDLAVRLTAARALLQKDKVASLRALLAALNFSPDDPPLILAEIFTRLPASLRPESIALLAEDIPAEWKRMLVIALGRNQAGEAFEAIAGLRRAELPRLRAAVWVALHELGDPRVGEFVSDGLRDASASVRQAACACAGTLGGPEVLPRLAELLDDADWWVRFAAANALYDAGAGGRQLLESHCAGAAENDVGLQVLREREMEAEYER